jgi:hypothetical protein
MNNQWEKRMRINIWDFNKYYNNKKLLVNIDFYCLSYTMKKMTNLVCGNLKPHWIKNWIIVYFFISSWFFTFSSSSTEMQIQLQVFSIFYIKEKWKRVNSIPYYPILNPTTYFTVYIYLLNSLPHITKTLPLLHSNVMNPLCVPMRASPSGTYYVFTLASISLCLFSICFSFF